MKLCWACQMEFIFVGVGVGVGVVGVVGVDVGVGVSVGVGVGVGRYKKQLHFSLLIRSIRQPFRHISSDSYILSSFLGGQSWCWSW